MLVVTEVEFKSNKDEIKKMFQSTMMDWLDAIGEDAAMTAAEKAPVDTGALKKSIDYAIVADEKAVYIGTNIPYAIYQELGTFRIAGKHYLQFGASAHANEYGKLLARLAKQ